MGRVIHFEIHAEDPERASAFYRAVFGWEIKKWDGPVDYWLITTGPDAEAGINGALIRRMGSGEPAEGAAANAFVNTIEVASVEETEKAVPIAGGEQVVARDEIPGVGQLSYFKDTEGNVFGALEPAPDA
jgi:predicted enzyme related to lactoylglutathione lyase